MHNSTFSKPGKPLTINPKCEIATCCQVAASGAESTGSFHSHREVFLQHPELTVSKHLYPEHPVT